MSNELKNAQIATTIKNTRKRREIQTVQVREIKLNPTKEQATLLNRVFLEAKWIRNDALSHGIQGYVAGKTVQVKNRDGKLETRDLTTIGSQIKQSVVSSLMQDARNLSKKKKKGYKVGKLKFARRVNSIDLKQYKSTYNIFPKENAVKIQNIGTKIKAYGLSQLYDFDERELANAKLVKKPSGFYLKITTFIYTEVWLELDKKRFTPGTNIGIDMGVKTHLTLSDGRKINVLVPETKRLKKLQKKLHRQYTKGEKSKNYLKTRNLLEREYEKMDNLKGEKSRKIVSELLKYENIYFQDENLSAWKVLWGKRLHHSVLGRVKTLLMNHPRAHMLDKYVATTQTCPECHKKTKHSLDERVYTCSHCEYSEDRDIHSANNMIWMYDIPRDAGELTPLETL